MKDSGNNSNDGDNSPSNSNSCKGCIIPRTSHAVIMPGDLILEEGLISGSGNNDVLSLTGRISPSMECRRCGEFHSCSVYYAII